MMKYSMVALSLLTAVVLSACAAPAPAPATLATAALEGEAQVRDLVENFGGRLQTVALLAPDAAQQIQTQYAGLASPALIETWAADVSKAPGRVVSSPWPDRIEISSVDRESAGRYVIDGFIVEITSTEVGSGGAAARIPVQIVVEGEEGRWLITAYAEGR
ncbi:MAG TPA: hypothetical protein VIU39_06720 [Anaerolineales bacterium]